MALTVAVATGLMAGLSGALAVATTTATAEALAALEGAGGAVRVQARVQDDDAAQTAAMRAALDARFGAGVIEVDRMLQAAGVPVGAGGAAGDAPAIDLLAGEVLDAAVRIVDGARATAADEVVLHAAAAEQMGLAVGDALVIDPAGAGASLTLAGTWLPVDAADPLWFGDALVAAGILEAGTPEQRLGPAIVAETALDGLDPRPYATFIVRPSAGLVDPGSLTAVRKALDGLDGALRDDPVAGRGGVIVDGRLGASLGGVVRSLAAVSAVAPVPVLIVGVVAALALLQVMRLVVVARSGEAYLLRARGGGTRALLRRAAGETLVVVGVPTAAAAAVVASIVLASGGASTAPLALRAAAVALAAGLAAGMLMLVLTAAQLRSIGRRESRFAGGRAAPAVSVVGVVIVLAAAALAVEQLRRSGSPLVPGAGGEPVINPIAVLAPVLALLAAALLVGAVFPALARSAAHLAARRRSAGPVLVTHALGRLGAVFAVPVLLVSLAAGSAVLAAVYDASWSRGDALAFALRDGADARALLPPQPALPARSGVQPADLGAVAALEGVADAALASVRAANLLEDEASVVAVSAARLGAVSALPPAQSARIAAALAPGRGDGSVLPGIPLPEGTTGVEIEVDADTVVETAVWAVEAGGAVQRLRTGEAIAPGAWTIVGLDVAFPADDDATAGDAAGSAAPRIERSARVIGLTATTSGDGAQELPVPIDWQLAPASSSRPALGPGGIERAVIVDADEGVIEASTVTEVIAPEISLRFVDPAALNPLPAVVSEELATRVDRGVGDAVTLGFSGSGRVVTATIEAVVDAVPAATAPAAMLVDLAALTTQLIATSSVVPPAEQVWIAADSEAAADPAALAARAATLLGGMAVPSGADRALVALARDALWLGAAGAVLLAVLGVAVAAAVRSSAAGREVVTLRALGVTARYQARMRAGELAFAVAAGALGGLLGGAIAAALVVPALAGAAIPPLTAAPGLTPLAAPVAVPLAVDPLALATLLLGAGILIALVIARSAAGVRRRALTAAPREESA